MTKYAGQREKYNLHCAFLSDTYQKEVIDDTVPSPIVRIPMPRFSLLVLYGQARYEWEHCIYRSDISNRRICMAYREFTPEYLQGGKSHYTIGKDVISKAHIFW